MTFCPTRLARLWAAIQSRAARSHRRLPVLMRFDEAAHVPGVVDQLLEWTATSRALGVQMVTLW
jgi:hypothetical protein